MSKIPIFIVVNIIFLQSSHTSITLERRVRQAVLLSKRLECYACSVDFTRTPFSANDSCLMPPLEPNKRSIKKDLLTKCSQNAEFCQAEVTKVMGVLTGFDRRCADDCAEACFDRALGIPRQVCTICCKNDTSCGTNKLGGLGLSSSTLHSSSFLPFLMIGFHINIDK